MVTKVDQEARRISLSLKQLSPHPWSNIGERYKVGDVVEGKVVRLTSFGAFVNLEEGVDGLIHISQLSDRRVEKPDDVVQVGETVRAKVLKVEPEERRIGLSIRATLEKRWSRPGSRSKPRPPFRAWRINRSLPTWVIYWPKRWVWTKKTVTAEKTCLRQKAFLT